MWGGEWVVLGGGGKYGGRGRGILCGGVFGGGVTQFNRIIVCLFTHV